MARELKKWEIAYYGTSVPEPEPDPAERERQLARALNNLLLAVDGLPEALDQIVTMVECECGNPEADECERCDLIRYSERLKSAFNSAVEIMEDPDYDDHTE